MTDTYRDAKYPTGWEGWDRPIKDAWKDGVDAHVLAMLDKEKARVQRADVTADGVRTIAPEGQDKGVPAGTLPGSLSRDVSAFLAITEDRRQDARGIVQDMSGRDRAVLSFWLRELSREVEDIEDMRTRMV